MPPKKKSRVAAAGAAAAGADDAAPAADGAGGGGPAATPGFNGAKFVVTGEFNLPKSQLEDLITKLGGQVVQSVSKSTSYLLLGRRGTGQYGTSTGPGTQKHKDAKKRKVKIVDEAWLVAHDTDDNVPPCASAGEIRELWERVCKLHEQLNGSPMVGWNVGASPEAIKKAEDGIGYMLPAEMRELYLLSDGMGGNLSKIDSIAAGQGQSDERLDRLYRKLRMICISEYVHTEKTGYIFEWDTSFDSQCGNTIIASSWTELLKRWGDDLERALAEKGMPPKEGEKPRHVSWRPEHETTITRHGTDPFVKRFVSMYEQCLQGRFPMYVD